MRTRSKENSTPYNSFGGLKMVAMDTKEFVPPISPLASINMVRAHSGRCILVDCRSFLAYNVSHIRASLNIHCPPILKRRLLRGSATLSSLLTCPETRGIVDEADTLIFYDDRTYDWKDTEIDSTIKIVARLLRWEKTRATFYYIKGGFERFSALYPTMCEFANTQHYNTTHPSPLALKLKATADCRRPFSPRYTDNDQQIPVHKKAVNEPVELLSHLYLGNEVHASRKDVLKRLGITAIINVSRTIPNSFQDSFVYKTIPVDDTYNADIGSWFEEAAVFIDDVKRSGGRVFVHCQAGISRSATICLAYLISRMGLRLDEAYEFVKKRRSVISPNFNFMGQLLNWELENQAAKLGDELALGSPMKGCQSPFGFFNFSATFPCNTDQVVPNAKSPGLVSTPI